MEGESTSYNPNIPYTNDTLAFYHVPRVYEYECDGVLEKCGRYYVVGDGDVVYDVNGNATEYENTDPNTQYYVVNPKELKGCVKKDTVLSFYKVKPLSSVKTNMISAKLKFVGVSLRGCFEKEMVTFDDVFDLFEPPTIGKIKVFPISQARCMFSYFSGLLPIGDVWKLPTNFDDLFALYNVLNQFTDVADSVATNPSKYGKIKFKLNKKMTKEELDAFKEKKTESVSVGQKKELKKVLDEIGELEESSTIVKRYIELEEKLEKRKDKSVEKELAKLEKFDDEKLRRWLKLYKKADKLKTLPKVTLEPEDIIPAITSAKANYVDMIFSEYIPENVLEEDEEDEDFIGEDEEGDEVEEEDEGDSGTITEEEDESMESLGSSEEEEEDEVVDWKKLDEMDEDEEDDEDFEDESESEDDSEDESESEDDDDESESEDDDESEGSLGEEESEGDDFEGGSSSSSSSESE